MPEREALTCLISSLLLFFCTLPCLAGDKGKTQPFTQAEMPGTTIDFYQLTDGSTVVSTSESIFISPTNTPQQWIDLKLKGFKFQQDAAYYPVGGSTEQLYFVSQKDAAIQLHCMIAGKKTRNCQFLWMSD